MRRTALLLALVLCCALLGACGKGGYSAGGASSTSTAGTPATRGGRAPTHAQALAFAHVVNLTAADVPGFAPSAKDEHESPAERRLQKQLRGCSGAAGSHALGRARGTLVEASSPNFTLRRGILELTVSSEVSVAHTSAEATARLSAIRSPRVRACFTRYLSGLLKSQRYTGATVVGVSIDAGTPPAHGTTGGFAWRVTATLAIRGIRLSFYFDILGFVYGPAQVTLSSSGTVRPFPASAQEQLYSRLLTRAKQHRV